MLRRAVWVGFSLAWLASSGCALIGELADPTGRQKSLEDSQRKYTELVRWGQLERASDYVDPELREQYLNHAEAFARIRFTDFESGQLVIGDDGTATTIVVYHAYSLRTLLEKRILERQQWYRDDKTFRGWRVRPQLRQVIAGVTGP